MNKKLKITLIVILVVAALFTVIYFVRRGMKTSTINKIIELSPTLTREQLEKKSLSDLKEILSALDTGTEKQ